MSERPLGPRGRVWVRIACVLVLAATFIPMEFALAWKGDIPDFVKNVREFIFSTLWMPFFLGVLMGHWYHPVPAWYGIMNRLYRGHQLIPPLILLGVAMFILTTSSFFHYARDYTIPSWLSFIAVCVGVPSGMLLWPVRVLPPIVSWSKRKAFFIALAIAATVCTLVAIIYLVGFQGLRD